MNTRTNCEWESLKGRALLGAIRLAVMSTGVLVIFPLGCWLAVEHWDAKDLPLYGALLLMVLAGVLADAVAGECRRVAAWNAEAERLRWQEENDFPPPGGAADHPGGESAASSGGGDYFEGAGVRGSGVGGQGSEFRNQPVEGGRR
jgi:hypothetical protein